MLTQTNMLARWSRKCWQPMNHFQLGSQQDIPSSLSQKTVNLPRRGAAFSKHTVGAQMWTCHWAWSRHRSPAAPHSQLPSLPPLSIGSTGKHALAGCWLRSTSQVWKVSLAARWCFPPWLAAELIKHLSPLHFISVRMFLMSQWAI